MSVMTRLAKEADVAAITVVFRGSQIPDDAQTTVPRCPHQVAEEVILSKVTDIADIPILHLSARHHL